MKNLLTVSIVAFICSHLGACGDSNVSQTPSQGPSETQNVSSDLDGDTSDGASSDSDVEHVGIEDGWDVAPDTAESPTADAQEPNQLPSDPTEDPGQEASFYEFPAWNIPAPPKQ